MENQLKEIFGAWIQAIGTVTSAVGSVISVIAQTKESLEMNTEEIN